MELKKCKFAGDNTPGEEQCSKCNGVSMFVGGQTMICEQCCAGFESDENEVEQPKQNVFEEEAYESKAQVTLIGAKSGLSKEINGMWYKFEAWEERAIPISNDIEVDMQKEKQMLFDDLNKQVDNQVLDVIKQQQK